MIPMQPLPAPPFSRFIMTAPPAHQLECQPTLTGVSAVRPLPVIMAVSTSSEGGLGDREAALGSCPGGVASSASCTPPLPAAVAASPEGVCARTESMESGAGDFAVGVAAQLETSGNIRTSARGNNNIAAATVPALSVPSSPSYPPHPTLWPAKHHR